MTLSMRFRTTVFILSTLIVLLASFPVIGQESKTSESETSTQDQSATAQATPNPTPTSDDYVFPTSEQRLKRYGRSMFGPFALFRLAASAGITQWKDSPEEWEQGAEGYGKRLASEFGRNAIRQTVTYGLSEAFRLDTGFERSKRKGFGPRLKDALIQNITSRTRRGKRVLSVPILAGNYVAPVIAAESWYPERYSYKDGLRAGNYSLAAGFGINIVREFLFNW